MENTSYGRIFNFFDYYCNLLGLTHLFPAKSSQYLKYSNELSIQTGYVILTTESHHRYYTNSLFSSSFLKNSNSSPCHTLKRFDYSLDTNSSLALYFTMQASTEP